MIDPFTWWPLIRDIALFVSGLVVLFYWLLARPDSSVMVYTAFALMGVAAGGRAAESVRRK